jgi:thiamine pyrophosphokinase
MADSSTTVVVVTGGDPLDGVELPSFPDGSIVIAADSGVDRAHALGLQVDVAVGDFDSVTGAGLDRVAEAGARIDRHAEAKDATDLELALDVARSLEPERIVVLGGHGGRLDHLLANALLLAQPALGGVEVVAQMGAARVTVITASAELRGAPGDLVTLLPLHGPARSVTTDGLLYPLHGETLLPGSTRGVSNELVAPIAVVSVREGTLLAVQPGLAGTHHLKDQA